MRLLFDQNISHRLVGMLTAEFPRSSHVVSLGLDTSTDQDIWDYAGEHGFTIVSKDADFRQLAFLKGPVVSLQVVGIRDSWRARR